MKQEQSILSERQQKILEFIIDYFQENEYPPSIREIGKNVGISSTSVVNYNLARLEELEYINRRKEVSRGLSVNWDRLHELGIEATNKNGSQQFAGLPFQFSKNGDSGKQYAFRVPVLGRIAAGEPIQVEARDSANPEEWIDLTEGMFGQNKMGASDNLFALKVQGDSMIDASVMDGDTVILRHQEQAQNGEMVAVWIEGDEETTLKYWHMQEDKVHLKPANPFYEPIVRDANKVRVKGRVVSVIRYLQ
ncbi:MAG: transcriptional repressor LexA [Chloroflexota bacterium]